MNSRVLLKKFFNAFTIPGFVGKNIFIYEIENEDPNTNKITVYFWLGHYRNIFETQLKALLEKKIDSVLVEDCSQKNKLKYSYLPSGEALSDIEADCKKISITLFSGLENLCQAAKVQFAELKKLGEKMFKSKPADLKKMNACCDQGLTFLNEISEELNKLNMAIKKNLPVTPPLSYLFAAPIVQIMGDYVCDDMPVLKK